jgi:DNA polymerase elongation subunit (family B)
MLLLKKKKYAAVKVQFKDGTPYEVIYKEKNKSPFGFSYSIIGNKGSGFTGFILLVQVIERKGLDMVRRDWSLISKELGDFCLSQILSGGYIEFYFFFFVNIVVLICSKLAIKDKQLGYLFVFITYMALLLTGRAMMLLNQYITLS